MPTDSDSESAAKVLGIIASIIGILTFFGISNCDDLKSAASSSSSEPSDGVTDVIEDYEGIDDTEPDPEPEPETEPETEPEPELEVSIDYAAVGDCIDRDRGIVVSCEDGTADYQVAARYWNPGGDPGQVCANAGYGSTPTSPAFNYVVADGDVLLCIYEI